MKPTLEQMPEIVVSMSNRIDKLTELLVDQKEREEILTRDQVAAMLGRHVKTISDWAKKGELTSYMKGGTYYFLRSEIIQSVKASKLKVA